MTEQEQWSETWSRLGAAAPEGLFAELVARYSEPNRFYHTLQHLRECFSILDLASHLARRLAEVQLALWFHDAFYDTRGQDNEEQSAQWAEESLVAAGAGLDAAARVRELVLATKHNAVPEEEDAKLLVDVDLSILGAAEPRFAEYERQVRQEYGWVPEDAFRQGRARILASLLNRASLYSTAWFVSRLEEQARKNLSRSLKELVV
ncbi:MAG TPA: N-methyl-D-aspartate receptor NMDAR2C subunit [Candidatus Binatia bacterium]|nr:N-methyl-D-aspartate receptor NMDAR2C subunit [Candidatus Binatia bacterium]